MKNSSVNILRVGLAITFLWIAILIIRDPEAWGGLIRPWAADLLPVPLKSAMIGTAVLDALIGLMLLVDAYVLVFALLGMIHLMTVLVVVGIDIVTVRDIGLLAGCLALVFAYWPEKKFQYN